MSLRYLAGFITASYNPLKVPNAPTIGTATAGTSQATITFTAPSNVGASAITSYIAVATKTSDGTAVSATGSASPITITGLTNDSAYTIQVCAVNTYGPGPYSAPSGSVTPYAPKLFSWGQNQHGQLGQGDNIARSSPVQVGALTNWSVISAGLNTAFVVKTDGTLWAWGNNRYGQLGQNNVTYRSSPVQIGALTTWSKVDGGNYSATAVKTDGTLWSWGLNDVGQLGQNDTVYRSSPVQVGALTTWSVVSNGINNGFGMAIKTDGTLWVWGSNQYGQLGINNATNTSSPVQVGALTNWSSIRVGFSSTLAIKTDGTLWSWGQNNNGQLGDGTVASRSSPVQVGALTTWNYPLMSKGLHATAVKSDGTIWSWGQNNKGQLGQNDRVYRSSPTQIGAGTTWLNVSGGRYNTLAVKTDGTLWSWGNNDNGVLGLNIVAGAYRSSPVQVGSGTGWKNSANGYPTFALAISS